MDIMHEMEGLSKEEILLIEVSSAVNKEFAPDFMPSLVKVGSGQMENQ